MQQAGERGTQVITDFEKEMIAAADVAIRRQEAKELKELAIKEWINGMVELLDEPCGCFACNDGVQLGHFLCDQPNRDMLALEKTGQVSRHLVGGPGSFMGPQRWAWFVLDETVLSHLAGVVEAAQFTMSPEGHKPGSGAMGQLKAAVAAYNEAQEQ